jgi:acyl-CoA synthetase (AMP-forming)/AMP-acid ligase II
VLWPPDLPFGHLASVLADAEVESIILDTSDAAMDCSTVAKIVLDGSLVPRRDLMRGPAHETEWVLLTSGTSGQPKLVVHTLSTLAGPIKVETAAEPVKWSTFYDIRRYGGLQILLRALLGGSSLVLSGPAETTADFLGRVKETGVTHLTGTPSHWRRALMSPAARTISPRYVRLSGEIADQTILDRLKAFYPHARIAHAFASTEAGLAFEVEDGLAGIPAGFIDKGSEEVAMKVIDGSLRIRSGRCALRYLGANAPEQIADEDGFVDTGDMLELRGDRYHFVGRRGGMINIGGRKVHPEEIETVIARHPSVEMVVVKARRNAITGAVATAEIVAKAPGAADLDLLKDQILAMCREDLASYKVPATIRFISALDLGASGKLTRSDA